MGEQTAAKSQSHPNHLATGQVVRYVLSQRCSKLTWQIGVCKAGEPRMTQIIQTMDLRLTFWCTIYYGTAPGWKWRGLHEFLGSLPTAPLLGAAGQTPEVIKSILSKLQVLDVSGCFEGTTSLSLGKKQVVLLPWFSEIKWPSESTRYQSRIKNQN